MQDKRKSISFVPATAYSRDTEACCAITATLPPTDKEQDMGHGSYRRGIPDVRAVLGAVIILSSDLWRIYMLISSRLDYYHQVCFYPVRNMRPDIDSPYKKRFTSEVTGANNLTFFEALNSEVMT